MNLEFPDAEALRGANNYTASDLPEFAVARRRSDPLAVDDLTGSARAAVGSIDAFGDAPDTLPEGSEIGITVGSRGIHDMPTVIRAVVAELDERGYEPFIIPAMGSHGGATAEGQVETLEALGYGEPEMGCPIRSSMDVEVVGTDDLGRPVYAAVDALEADAVLLANRVKLHTDFRGDVESGLSKIAVVGLGKHRGAESLHNAAIATDFADVIVDRMDVLLEETPIVGGVALIENANDRAAHIEGVNAEAIPKREPKLLELADEEFADLPIDELDMLVVDAAGKDKSGTGMDTNVLGRYHFHGESEPETPNVTRVYARSLTEPSHGNALGVGLADFVHREFVEAIDFTDTYVNIVTSGETNRAKIPFVVPDDETALLLACSTTGVVSPKDLRVARIRSTMEPNRLVVSEPVAAELRERNDFEVGPSQPLVFEDGSLPADPY
ncbi:lactate racemase domain-containing protein [Halorubrum gandharaense]